MQSSLKMNFAIIVEDKLAQTKQGTEIDKATIPYCCEIKRGHVIYKESNCIVKNCGFR